ncbi:mitochondrial 37S ribosomal protein MRP1 [Sugiyamaella lignohabitans]|uniref:Mitochondrial 37S ribosomal protein MRP1 n=1 Tax=Sugiyamaella lignohabitans TaxID=796027 RepID=A0A167FX55_9ASCO|nr:mitochondrial 37S ribosomal protein MRP1 [Sugiyamaella lignohabitans]ANB15814.1 mitochondrial 37S ribosomal protein MRP1 [Sugiyamaella lignohabitans]
MLSSIRGGLRQPSIRATWAIVRSSPGRSLHTVPEMPHLDREKGISGLLSPKGLEVAWFQYQAYLINELNKRTQDTYLKDSTPFQIMRATADLPEFHDINFYASQAYSNEFFFESLKDSVNLEAKIGRPVNKSFVDISTHVINSPFISAASSTTSSGSTSSSPDSSAARLSNLLTHSFDTAVSFRELLINRADSIFGNGYVWLLWLSDWDVRLVNTYNSGTPLSHVRNTETAEAAAHNSARSFGQINSSFEVNSNVPLLNFNAWQHVYLTDYGVAGKRKFLENLFDCIDWDRVSKRIPKQQEYGTKYQ